MTRSRLPNRRETWTVPVTDDSGHEYAVSYSVYPGDWTCAELFFSLAGKSGSDREIELHDASICASLALQHGCTPESLYRTTKKLENGKPASMIGRALKAIIADVKKHKSESEGVTA